MRRKDREVNQFDEIIDIVKKCDVCRIAFHDGEYPYIVPLNFGFTVQGTDMELYFHCAKEGKKLELLSANPKVAFEMDCSHNLITGEKACDYTMEFESVCGTGVIEVLPEDHKIEALNHLMRQYSENTSFEFNEHHLRAVAVLRLKVNQITGKRLKRQ